MTNIEAHPENVTWYLIHTYMFTPIEFQMYLLDLRLVATTLFARGRHS